uniref:Uncharacterized protein n=1 Tax=Clytia hemisphaerica TaxID=252671 RepID=A0A7M5XGQ2_9CNID
MIRLILLFILCFIGMQYYYQQTEQIYADMLNREKIASQVSVRFGTYFPENHTLVKRDDNGWIEYVKSEVINYFANKTLAASETAFGIENKQKKTENEVI